MKPPINGGSVLITGASSGIGHQLALQLAPRAAKLILVARRTQRLQDLQSQLQSQHSQLTIDIYPCDLSDMDARTTLIESVKANSGRIDVLINCAGVGSSALFEATSWLTLQTLLRLNVEALSHLSHAFLPDMLQQEAGGILNISSGFGFAWMPMFSVYGASKHYVTALSEGLRCELRGTGVVVSQVCPGPVDTEFESVAGAPGGQNVPTWLAQSAEAVARSAIAGFDRDKALIIPGVFMKVASILNGLSPRFLLRLIYGPLGAIERQRLKALSPSNND